MQQEVCQIEKIFKFIVFNFLIFSLFSCNKKDVLLPQAHQTIEKDIVDHSPIYMFFKVEEKDTIVDLNRKNSISSTHWIFNIDRRLPIQKVIPEISKLQAKKEASAHSKKGAKNVFSYADTLHKNLAFVDFTKHKFLLNNPSKGAVLYFSKNDTFTYKNKKFPKNEFEVLMENLTTLELYELHIAFDKNMNYGQFLSVFIEMQSLEIKRNFEAVYFY